MRWPLLLTPLVVACTFEADCGPPEGTFDVFVAAKLGDCGPVQPFTVTLRPADHVELAPGFECGTTSVELQGCSRTVRYGCWNDEFRYVAIEQVERFGDGGIEGEARVEASDPFGQNACSGSYEFRAEPATAE